MKTMLAGAALLVASSIGVAQSVQTIDLSSVDKMAAKAKEVNRVSLTRDQLKMFMQMSGEKDKDNVMNGIESVQVRNLEFAEPGQYSDADLDSVRNQVEHMQGCTAIVDSREKNEHSQVFFCTANDHPAGIAVIDAEPKEVSVVVVRGNLNFSDLGRLRGMVGVPFVQPLAPVAPPRPPRPPRHDDRDSDKDQGHNQKDQANTQ